LKPEEVSQELKLKGTKGWWGRLVLGGTGAIVGEEGLKNRPRWGGGGGGGGGLRRTERKGLAQGNNPLSGRVLGAAYKGFGHKRH